MTARIRERQLRQIKSSDPALTKLSLFGSNIPHGGWGELGMSIGSNTHLTGLFFNDYSHSMAKENFEKLFHGIACSASVQTLEFYYCDLFDGEIFSLLTRMFKRNHAICLKMFYCTMGPDCVHSLTSGLSEFESLKEFTLRDSNINNNGPELELIQSLHGHSGLESLCFNDIGTGVGNQGAALSSMLQNAESNLTTLELRNTNINPVGWQAIFASLGTPTCRLRTLDLSFNDIGDDTLLSLSNGLIKNSVLRELGCRNMNGITDRGWQGFMAALASPHSALKKLDLRGNIGITAWLANALAGNKKLEVLAIMDEVEDIASSGEVWTAVSHGVCNTSSIMRTHNSNHTLKALWADDDDHYDDLTPDIRALLDINRMCNPSQAAHTKIIMTHFSGDVDVEMFADMRLSALPHAIAWVGRHQDDHAVNGVYEHLAQMGRDEEAAVARNGKCSRGACEMSLLYQIVRARAADMSNSL